MGYFIKKRFVFVVSSLGLLSTESRQRGPGSGAGSLPSAYHDGWHLGSNTWGGGGGAAVSHQTGRQRERWGHILNDLTISHEPLPCKNPPCLPHLPPGVLGGQTISKSPNLPPPCVY